MHGTVSQALSKSVGGLAFFLGSKHQTMMRTLFIVAVMTYAVQAAEVQMMDDTGA